MGFVVPAAVAAVSSIGGMFAGGSALATALTVGSTALGVAGSLMEGRAQSQMYNYRAQVAMNNAIMAERDIDRSLIAGQREESEIRMKTGQLVSSQKAAQAASGVDTEVGTAPFVRDITAAQGDMDALTMRFNAAQQAYNFKVEAANQRAESNMMKRAAKTAKLKSYIGAASALVGGMSKLSNAAPGKVTAAYGGDPSSKVIV